MQEPKITFLEVGEDIQVMPEVHYKFLYNVEDLRRFHTFITQDGLKADEVLFVSLSARNKYLTDEERKALDLGRTEMFRRELIKDTDFKAYLRTILCYDTPIPGSIISRSGADLPEKCLVLYANINPLSGKKALQLFFEDVTKRLFNLGTNQEELGNLKNMDTILKNSFQKARASKNVIDIDFDVPEEGTDLVLTFLDHIKEKGVEYMVIKTKGGYHVMLRRETLKFNYPALLGPLNEQAKARFGHAEVIINENAMVPIPGTQQAGEIVRIVDL